jgi:hypothetical protein
VFADVLIVVVPRGGAGEEASASEPPQPGAGGERSEPPLKS